MLEKKSKRGPTRTPQEKLEDAFMDLSLREQVAALATFQTLHRMKRRLMPEEWIVIPNATDLTTEHDPQGSLIDGAATETGTPLKGSAE